MVGFVWFLFLLVCFILILVVMLQRGDAGGVGAAFGGGGGDTAFGVTADMTWKKTTAYLAGAFFFLALLLSYLMGTGNQSSIVDAAPIDATANENPGAPADTSPEKPEAPK